MTFGPHAAAPGKDEGAKKELTEYVVAHSITAKEDVKCLSENLPTN